MTRPRLSLGPVLYYWPRERLLAFYDEVCRWPVDTVYLGETVCSKRRALRTREWFELAERLAQAGKEVVLSTLALIEAESELKTLRRICDNGRFLVEANDMSAVRLLAERGLPFATGPTVNVYNQRTLAFLARLGLRRWVLPPELSRQTLAAIQAERPEGVETEVLAWGRIPLAHSARCFTARAENRQKDDCGECCIGDPDGRTVRTGEDTPFLALNGIQTQSALTCNLLGEVDDMAALGVDLVRISPQSEGTGEVVAAFRRVLDGAADGRAEAERVAALAPVGPCDGYWRGAPGMTWRQAV
ncbi:U32 family peptidase [Inmirania thermothiophila]|uniref:Ubiquinone biosynthesis protein UbiV n=1 Tax=Inmirania thermothiophila TaxID=1750597 RepID=A0A3N1XSG3_9GAMM|nr:U32 family peptidase [Inmirania thermothiophila]ROR29585.1 collagenase-like PrtC family protease [Inmirania thermothiophila]